MRLTYPAKMEFFLYSTFVTHRRKHNVRLDKKSKKVVRTGARTTACTFIEYGEMQCTAKKYMEVLESRGFLWLTSITCAELRGVKSARVCGHHSTQSLGDDDAEIKKKRTRSCCGLQTFYRMDSWASLVALMLNDLFICFSRTTSRLRNDW